MLATVHFVNPTAAPDLMSRFMPNAPTAAGSEAALRRKAAATRDYFDDDDDDDRLPVGPAVSADVDDELDPLDQFMAGVGSVVQSERQAAPVAANVLPEIVSGHERDYEGYYDMVDKQAKADAEAAEVEYDSDGIPVGLRGAASEGGKKIM